MLLCCIVCTAFVHVLHCMAQELIISYSYNHGKGQGLLWLTSECVQWRGSSL